MTAAHIFHKLNNTINTLFYLFGARTQQQYNKVLIVSPLSVDTLSKTKGNVTKHRMSLISSYSLEQIT